MKDNQGRLLQDIGDWFAYADQIQFQKMQYDFHEMVNKGHGRIQIRRCWVVADPLAFNYIRQYQGWADLQTIVRIQRERHFPHQVQRETAYYISSLPPRAPLILQAARSHWTVENSLHWVLDVTFREDDARIRHDNSPQNMAVWRPIALNINQDVSPDSNRAALDDSFLSKLLTQF